MVDHLLCRLLPMMALIAGTLLLSTWVITETWPLKDANSDHDEFCVSRNGIVLQIDQLIQAATWQAFLGIFCTLLQGVFVVQLLVELDTPELPLQERFSHWFCFLLQTALLHFLILLLELLLVQITETSSSFSSSSSCDELLLAMLVFAGSQMFLVIVATFGAAVLCGFAAPSPTSSQNP